MKSWNRKAIQTRLLALLASLVTILVFLSAAPLVPEDTVQIRARAQESLLQGFIDHHNPAIDPDERDRVIEALIREANRLKVPDAMLLDGRPINRLHLVAAFVQVESHFKRTAVSSADARGYMQMMPATARWLDEKYGTDTPIYRLFETDANIATGVTYISHLMEFLDNPRHVALAYNAGPGNLLNGIYVERYWIKIRKAYRELGQRESEALAAAVFQGQDRIRPNDGQSNTAVRASGLIVLNITTNR